ncbi:primosomal protein N' [Synergistales bacterium]|nr:primosomal protein N' [Synergistales bacterium]
MRRVEIIFPGPWWNTLTYLCDEANLPIEGARVLAPVGRGTRVGFALKETPPSSEAKGFTLKAVTQVLDNYCVLGDDLWNLALWAGRAFLCGSGEALQLACPPPILKGEAVSLSKQTKSANKREFQELSFFHPLDGVRKTHYREAMLASERTLAIFPEKQNASAFFDTLPETLKARSILWPSVGGKKLMEAWKTAALSETLNVIGSLGAVFAPSIAGFDTIIVEEEAASGYVFTRNPKISARSLAGQRALFLGSKLILGGRMPSAKTFLRTLQGSKTPLIERHPQIEKNSFIIADSHRSVKADTDGIDGRLPLTVSLLERTRIALHNGHNALWILDRKGQAGEVSCSDCGASLSCERCGSIMRMENPSSNQASLRCVMCGRRENLPTHCPVCRGSLLMGKRPGIEALSAVAERYLKGYKIVTDEKKQKPPFLMLGTRKILSLCDRPDVGLVGWIDSDAESRKTEYGARAQAFSMILESYWRGRDAKPELDRVVVVQTLRPKNPWINSFKRGWRAFWEYELRERKELLFPPCGLLVRIDMPENWDTAERQTLISSLEDAKLSVMSDGGEKSPIWLTLRSIAPLAAALAPSFEIKRSRVGFPTVTVYPE